MFKTYILLALTIASVHCNIANVTMRYFNTKLSHIGLAGQQTF